MKIIILYFILITSACNAQVGVFPSTVFYSSGTTTLINDNFNEVQLSTHWKLRDPSKTTITPSSQNIRIIGNSENKNLGLILTDTTFDYTVQRSYNIEAGFRINDIDSVHNSIYIGVKSINDNYTFQMSSYGFLDFHNDSLFIATSDDTLYTPRGVNVSGLPDFNTSDYYKLKFWVEVDSAKVRIINVTTGDSSETGIKYNFNAAGSTPLRPNTFYFGFGIAQKTDLSIDYYKVTTNDEKYPNILFIGNSITVGYAATTSDSSYAAMMQNYTNKSVEVFAGSGATLLDLYGIKDKISAFYPQYCFMALGTNSGGTISDYENFVDYLNGFDITCYQLATPNGGNPDTPGTWNYQLKESFPLTFLDIWTTGWNTMSTGNGEMYDSNHPSLTGHRKLAALIKSFLPTLFYK